MFGQKMRAFYVDEIDGRGISSTFLRSFYVRRSQKHKKTVKSSVFLCFLGSACVKAVHKHDKHGPRARVVKSGDMNKDPVRDF